MAVYAGAIVVRWLDAPVPACTHKDLDHFILVWDAIADAVSYEFTTDGGNSWLPIVSGVDVTTDSRGAALVESIYYEVQVHSVGIGGPAYDISGPSEILSIYTNPVDPPTLLLLVPYPTEDPAIWIMRGRVVAWGGAAVTITFQLGLTIGYGTNVVLEGTYTTGERAVKAAILLPERTWHLRMKGQNIGGIAYTADAILFTGHRAQWRIYEREVT